MTISVKRTFIVQQWLDPHRLDELRHMVHAAFREFEPPSGVLTETLDDFAARFRDGSVLVAQSDGCIIGSVFCARKDKSLYLTRLAVAADWRRGGVGAALVRAAESEARRLDLPMLSLRVRKTLSENRHYFESFGFIVTGEGQEGGRTPFDVMEKPRLARNSRSFPRKREPRPFLFGSSVPAFAGTNEDKV